MLIKDIPDYVLRPFVKSRTTKPLEFAGAVQLVRRDAPDKNGIRRVSATYTAVMQGNLVSATRANVPASGESIPSPRSWSTTSYSTPESALEAFREGVNNMFQRGYESIVDSVYLVPINSTDIKHVIRTKDMPHWILSVVYQNFMNIRAHVNTVEGAVADADLPPLPPSVAPASTLAPAAPLSKTAAYDAVVDDLVTRVSASHGKKMGI